jgi:nucleoside-diphosphate-sugar epimerase
VTLSELVGLVATAAGSRVRIMRFPWYGAAVMVASAVEAVCKRFGFQPPVFRRRLSWFKTNRAFRIDRARNELGYTPRVGLEEGLRRTAQWYRQQGYLAPALWTASAFM